MEGWGNTEHLTKSYKNFSTIRFVENNAEFKIQENIYLTVCGETQKSLKVEVRRKHVLLILRKSKYNKLYLC